MTAIRRHPFATQHTPPPGSNSVRWADGKNGQWTLNKNWSSGEVPTSSSNVTIAAPGNYTVTVAFEKNVSAHSLKMDNASATLDEQGTLSLAGALSVTAGTFSLDGGEVIGGTLSAGADGVFLWHGGLDNVTYINELDVDGGQGLYLTGDITLAGKEANGAGTINVNGAFFSLGEASFEGLAVLNANSAQGYIGNQTLDNATFNDTDSKFKVDGTFTLGTQLILNIKESDRFVIRGGSLILNEGLVNVDSKSSMQIINGKFSNQGLISINGGEVGLFTNLANTGTISISDGTLSLGHEVATKSLGQIDEQAGGLVKLVGTLTNTGATLSVGAGANLEHLSLSNSDKSVGEIIGGVIADGGGGLIGDGGTLTSVTYETSTGTMAGTDLVFAGSTVLTGAGGAGSVAVDVDNGGTLSVNGDVTGAATFDVTSAGSEVLLKGATLVTSSVISLATGTEFTGSGTVNGSITNNGTIFATGNGDTLTISGAVAGSGLSKVNANSFLELGSSVAAQQTVAFAGAYGDLRLDSAALFAGTINAFVANDVIDIGTLAATSATLSSTSLIVALSTGGSLTLAATGVPEGETVKISKDGHTLTATRSQPLEMGPTHEMPVTMADWSAGWARLDMQSPRMDRAPNPSWPPDPQIAAPPLLIAVDHGWAITQAERR